ncbi:MAG: hypothetical protein ACE14V_09205 [bacterium]
MNRVILILISILLICSLSIAKEKKIDRYDLDSPKFYTYTKYRSILNQPIYLDIQVIDKRPAADIDSDTTIWLRPITTMMQAVIEKELQIADIAKPPTAISTLNVYTITFELTLYTAKTQPKEAKKVVKWAIPQVVIGNTEYRVTISRPDGAKVNTTEYSGEASRDLVRTMDVRYWTAKMAAESFQSAMDQTLKDLDNILTRPSTAK